MVYSNGLIHSDNNAMTLCPIALAVSCTRCPVFKICPATRVLGDQKTVSSASLMRSSPLTQSLKKAVKKAEIRKSSAKGKSATAAPVVAKPKAAGKTSAKATASKKSK